MRFRNSRTAVIIATAAIVAASGATASTAAPTRGSAGCDTRVNNTIAKLLECVTVEGAWEHLEAFQAIADANGDTRASGTPGYEASVEYVVETMEAAGWDVTVQDFEFQTFFEQSDSILERIAPPPVGPIAHNIMEYSGSGDVTASVTALPAPPADATPGCEASDFAGFPVGNIALISRGGCTFGIKATNAYNAGASAVVIYNNIPGVLSGTLGNAFTLDIPVVSIDQATGQQLAATPGLVLRVKTDTFRGIATTSNVLAELAGKNTDNVVMAGAHLDSVHEGPGINDNGTGSAALLEVGQQLAKVKPQNTIRLAWWGAEEANLVGSTYYVNNLSEDELERIALYLNFDMIGSPNFVYFIYDGDDSDGVGAGPGPAGSAQIEQTFEAFYESRDIPYKGTDFSGRSDYGPFIAAGVPSGGLFTGAEGIKTAQEATIWGGTAGIAYDPCYHQACDTIDNVSAEAMGTNADAVAYAILSYAMSTELINGEKSKGNFRPGMGDHTAVTG